MGSSCFEVKNKNKDKKKECNKDNTTQCGDKNKVPVEDVSLLENKDNNNKKIKIKIRNAIIKKMMKIVLVQVFHLKIIVKINQK